MARMVDPAAGSWFVESLTSRLAESAWAGFRSIESAGGMETILRDGSLEAEILASWSSRLEGLATRQEPITGVSEFPLLDEPVLTRPSSAPVAGWPLRRLAEPFEGLRDESDRRLVAEGHRPRVHLATLGNLAEHTARTTWTTNLLAVGGIEAVGGQGDGAVEPGEVAARFIASGCDVAVICSSDTVYLEHAVDAARTLGQAGAVLVAMSGAPDELKADLAAAGVHQFWHPGLDLMKTLTPLTRFCERFESQMGVERFTKPGD